MAIGGTDVTITASSASTAYVEASGGDGGAFYLYNTGTTTITST